jgi:hypothetical protein
MASSPVIIRTSAEAGTEEVLGAIDRAAWILFLVDCLRLARLIDQREREQESSASCGDADMRLLASGR